MNLNKLIFFSGLILSGNLNAQLCGGLLDYRNRIHHSERYFTTEENIHSAILPFYYSDDIGCVNNPLQTTLNPDTRSKKNYSARLYPLIDCSAGLESQGQKTEPFRYNLGIGLGFEFSSLKWFATLKYLPYFSEPSFVVDSILQMTGSEPGTTRPISGFLHHRNEFIIAYQPNHIFTLSTGYGKNFFGEGYRSLFLSDNSSPYPFFKIQTSFGSIQYVNLYSVWKDNYAAPTDQSQDLMKFSSSHYLSWNIIPELNLGVFETVVWQAKDSLTQRNFDINYLNPVVFFRPVEYGLGSADNVLLGASLNYKPNQHHCIYSQVLLDEFLLSELKAGNHWWGNKFAVQAGYKSDQFFSDNLYFQLEFNMVRPFTYAHKYSVQSYGHMNAAVAHPAGANFYEMVQIMSYHKSKLRITNKITYLGIGIDRDSINQGQNIFRSYSDRAGNYGHKIMQGQRLTIINQQLVAEYPLLPKIELYLMAAYQYRMSWSSTQTIHQHYISVGIRSRIWNVYQDI